MLPKSEMRRQSKYGTKRTPGALRSWGCLQSVAILTSSGDPSSRKHACSAVSGSYPFDDLFITKLLHHPTSVMHFPSPPTRARVLLLLDSPTLSPLPARSLPESPHFFPFSIRVSFSPSRPAELGFFPSPWSLTTSALPEFHFL